MSRLHPRIQLIDSAGAKTAKTSAGLQGMRRAFVRLTNQCGKAKKHKKGAVEKHP